VAVSLTVLVVALLPFVLGRESEMLEIEPRGFLVGAAILGTVLLLVRRVYPWRAWAATTSVGLAAIAVGGGPTSAYVPAIVALFTISARVTTVRAVGASLVSALAPVALILAFDRDGAFDALAFGITAWSGVALMSGIAVRNSRALVASAQERARLAELTREEEAQLRVTEERFRIARELHDVVAHHVSVINVQAGVASHLVRTDPDSAAAAMTHVREASQTVLREVSTMLGLLRSDGDGLETAPVPRMSEVDGLVERARRSGAQVVWQTSGTPYELMPTVDLTAYRVMQEALTNAVRHGTGTIAVRLDFHGDALVLDIRNPPARLSAELPSGRHGLAGMRERVAAIGGTLEAGPGESGEWVVRALLPTVPAATDPRETSAR